jgi:hypothetical protein
MEAGHRFGDPDGVGAPAFADMLPDCETAGLEPDRDSTKEADVGPFVRVSGFLPVDEAVADDVRTREPPALLGADGAE